MCGYCVESIAVGAAKGFKLDGRPRKVWESVLELQEAPDVVEALSIAPLSVTRHPMVAHVIMARLLDDRIGGRLQNDVRQRLQTSTFATNLIHEGCQSARAAMAAAIQETPQLELLDWLFEPDTYLGSKANADRAIEAKVAHASINLYVDRWLEPLAMQASMPTIEDQDAFQGKEPSDGCQSARDRVWLSGAFLTIWASLLLASLEPASFEVIWPLVTRMPRAVPTFAALDLWLQRRAGLAVLRMRGDDPIVASIATIRPALAQYLAMQQST